MTDVDPLTLLFDPLTATNPHTAYAQMRDNCPVARAPGFAGGSAVYVTRYDDVLWALRHPEVFSSSAEAIALGQEAPLIPLQVDPPEHAKYRRLLDPEFSPKRMEELEPDVRALTNAIIDRFADRGGCDFHEDFATPYPSTIFLRLMGLPQDDLEQFLQWRDNTIRPDVDPGDVEGATRIREEAGHAITAYFEAAVDRARSQPETPDLLSRLVYGEMEGRPLTRDELLGTCHLMLLGGLDTVTATLDCMIAYLAAHPDRRAALAADPELAASAIEELLRSETPVMAVPRIIKADHEMRGTKIEAGDHAVLVLGAANTDGDEFADAESVVLERETNRHLAFGGGPHRCLGSHLARLELRVALEEFHRRIPDYHIPAGTELAYSPGIRQADHIPLVFGPDPTA
ncbi:MAG: cytochrome P450 [Actinobacteria bacterium]|nr:cytochrome P450 [Actinomycetota bacterium]